tara:strand:- start:5906 stop:6256 length:351 start_codon:yes stop_codon:yes gene_type:complete
MKNVKNAHMGQHLLVEIYNVDFDKLNDPEKIANVMVQAVLGENLTLLNTFVHQFEPYGVSCVLGLGESHASCHTWPDKKCVAIDIFTCGKAKPRNVAWNIMHYFDSDDYNMNELQR